ncbi:ArsR family transcriptional regulator [Halobacteriales archaeon QS_8_69_26]|nr:MAG: ArsR family transcriptional regulator [Halobacteriales archaeon QS_8_69_26]
MTGDRRRDDRALGDGDSEAFGLPSVESGGSERSGREGVLVDAPADSIREFMLEAVRRASILRALAGDTARVRDLTEEVDCSRSTVHRATTTLEEHDLIEQSDQGYDLTGLGKVVADETEAFAAKARAAVALEPFLNTVDSDGIPVEHFADARITRRKPRRPHASIHRITELIERSDTVRMLSTVISPIYVDVGYREMMDGTEIEAVFDREAIEIMLSEYAEKARETVSTGSFDLYVHEGLPFELFVFDDRMGMAAHDETGIAEVLVECEAPAAIEWGEDLYATHREEAQQL